MTALFLAAQTADLLTYLRMDAAHFEANPLVAAHPALALVAKLLLLVTGALFVAAVGRGRSTTFVLAAGIVAGVVGAWSNVA